MNNLHIKLPENMKALALAVHHRLMPAAHSASLLPYFWLPYLGFLFIEWFYRPVPAVEVAGTLLAISIFLPMYFRGYRGQPKEMPWLILATAALGFALLPFNSGAAVFLIYACAFCGFAGTGLTGAMLLLAVVAAEVVELLALGLPVGRWVWAPFISLMVGAGNFYFAAMARKNRVIEQSREEIRQLAATAERERIARDLHDLLGHTLTLITVKAELAGKLASGDLPRAAEEIHELEKIARDALAQVRQAVGGYRGNLAGEIANAGVALRASGVTFEADVPVDTCEPAHDAALAMIVREAVTNVVRHADATVCRLSVGYEGGTIALDISDDGAGGRSRAEGNGIRGMRERVQRLGGTLALDFGAAGTRLHATIPMQDNVRGQTVRRSSLEQPA